MKNINKKVIEQLKSRFSTHFKRIAKVEECANIPCHFKSDLVEVIEVDSGSLIVKNKVNSFLYRFGPNGVLDLFDTTNDRKIMCVGKGCSADTFEKIRTFFFQDPSFHEHATLTNLGWYVELVLRRNSEGVLDMQILDFELELEAEKLK